MITYHRDLQQGTPEWLQARCGLITASVMKQLITPTLKISDNEKSRMLLYELAAQRITQFIEPSYLSDDMDRGNFDEITARNLYNDKISPVEECGFITNDKWGFTLGYSPDGLVGNDGLIEIKSRLQKYQVHTVVHDVVPSEYMIQLQTGLLVSERKWIDFLQFSGGLVLYQKRVVADEKIQDAILKASELSDNSIRVIVESYISKCGQYLPTERITNSEQDIYI